MRDDAFSRVAPETIGGVIRSIVAAEGTVWAGSSAGALYRIEDDHATAVAVDEDLDRRPVSRVFVEPDGTLWIGTGGGVWRYRCALDRITDTRQVLAIRRAPATGEIWILTQSEILARPQPRRARARPRLR